MRPVTSTVCRLTGKVALRNGQQVLHWGIGGDFPILRRSHKRTVQDAIQYFSRCLIHAKILRRFAERRL